MSCLLRRFGVAAVWIIAASVVVRAQTPPTQTPPPSQPGRLTLEAAMQLAAEANPTIAAGRLGRASSLANVGVASERLNPELSYEWARETPRQSISAVFPLEFGKRTQRIALANAGVTTSEANLTRLITLLRSDVRRAYFASATAQQRLTMAEDSRGLAVRARDAARARFNAGDAAEIEAVQTELALADAENEVTGARGQVEATRVELNALLGQPATAMYSLTDDITSGTLPAPEDAVSRALGGNVELSVLDKQIAEQEIRRNLAKALQRPDMSAGSALTYDAQPEFRVGWRLSFAVTVPLFTRHQAGVLFEDAELTRLKAERAAMAAKVTGEVTAALARASAAREQMMRFQTENLPRIQRLEQMAQASYSSGQTGSVALLQSLQIARDMRKQGLQASIDYQTALADLERAIGAPVK